MNDAHRELRERLGTYVLGALQPEERIEVDEHLEDCSTCRDELARLSSLPSLLDRLSLEEATAVPLGPSPGHLEQVITLIDRERRRERRSLRVWQALAAASLAALALVLWAPWQQAPRLDALVAPAQPVGADVVGEAELMAWDWGTTVRLDVRELPQREGYVLWAVGEDGRRQQAGAWGPTAEGSARVIGASSILRDGLARVEVTDSSGALLATFEPPSG